MIASKTWRNQRASNVARELTGIRKIAGLGDYSSENDQKKKWPPELISSSDDQTHVATPHPRNGCQLACNPDPDGPWRINGMVADNRPQYRLGQNLPFICRAEEPDAIQLQTLSKRISIERYRCSLIRGCLFDDRSPTILGEVIFAGGCPAPG